MNQFLAHWTTATDALGMDGPFVLKGPVVRADLEALRDTLLVQRAAVESALNAREGARATLETNKARLLLWLNRFNEKLEATALDPKWLAMRPKVFSQSDGMSNVLKPLDDAADAWARYNAENTALTLLGGTTLVDFSTALAELKTLYSTYSVFENGIALARAERNLTQDRIRPILVLYRQTVPTAFAEDSAIAQTMPRYSPLPGHTPDPVVLSGAFDETAGEAQLSWSESADARLAEYEVRAVAGPEYDADDESVIANIPAGAPRGWAGGFGLAVPGAQVNYRVYVKTSTGNERASNTVILVRPPE